MFARNRVIWNEGLFIKPQHFQQQQRYTEYCLDERLSTVSRYLYGISELSLNPEYLSFGRIAIERAVGVMPDGTTFRIPQEDHLPDALEVTDASLANQIVYLAVPLRSESLMEINWPEERGTGAMSAVVSKCVMSIACRVIPRRLMFPLCVCNSCLSERIAVRMPQLLLAVF